MIKAAIFDADGLLLNSEPLHREASRQAFAKFGADRNKLSPEVASKIVGKKLEESVKMMCDDLGVDNFEALYKERYAIFIKLVNEKIKPMPGVDSVLQLCKNNGIKMAVASSGHREYLEIALGKIGIKKQFETIVSGDEVGKSKPDPQIFLLAAQKLGVDPKSCVVFEDADNGIEAAKRAGMKAIGIKSPFTEGQSMKKADIVKNSLEEITLCDLK